MIQDTISAAAARRYYDRLGARYDWFGIFEARAKTRAIRQLDLAPGQRVLNVGTGTGREQARLEAAVSPGGLVAGLDLSPGMLAVARRRTTGLLCRADARHLPLAPGSFDRVLATYILDLIPADHLPGILAGLRRLLKPAEPARGLPGGRLVLASLTEGITPASRALVAVWKRFYALNPAAWGGCRPLQLLPLVEQAGFRHVEREVVVQWALPSEVLAAWD